MSLDERAEAVSKIAPYQVDSYAVPLAKDDYWNYRFWGSLSSETKRALVQGRSVPLVQLGTPALEYLYYSETDESNYAWMHENTGAFDEPEFESLSSVPKQFMVRGELLDDEVIAPGSPNKRAKMRDKLFASMYPRFIAPDAYVKCKVAMIPALQTSKGELLTPQRIAYYESGQDIGPNLAEDMDLVGVQAFGFEIQLREDCKRQCMVSQMVPGDRKVHGRLDWPADLTKRVDAQTKQLREMLAGRRDGYQPPPY